MEGDGNVQSALYQARRKEANGARTVVPVFATSRSHDLQRRDRLLHYEGDVDIKQGTERITGGVADVYLLKETYEVERTSRSARRRHAARPQGHGRLGAVHAADETVVLTGNPAHVEDAEKGTSESNRMTVYLREDRVVSDGGGDPAPVHRAASARRTRLKAVTSDRVRSDKLRVAIFNVARPLTSSAALSRHLNVTPSLHSLLLIEEWQTEQIIGGGGRGEAGDGARRVDRRAPSGEALAAFDLVKILRASARG
jgi:lipopolysaccharide export system protein LptA